MISPLSPGTPKLEASRPCQNVAPTAEKDLLIIYNQVPKCGSTSIMGIFERLSRRNKFVFKHSKDYNHHHLTLQQLVRH